MSPPGMSVLTIAPRWHFQSAVRLNLLSRDSASLMYIQLTSLVKLHLGGGPGGISDIVA